MLVADPAYANRTVIVDLTDIAEVTAKEEQNLDPASQTGDFHLPDALLEGLELAERILIGNHTEADVKRLDELTNEIDAKTGSGTRIEVESLIDYETLVYHYADGRELEVLHPLSLSIRFDGAELISCTDRVGVVAPPGYLKCERFPKFGKPCFPGHKPVRILGGE